MDRRFTNWVGVLVVAAFVAACVGSTGPSAATPFTVTPSATPSIPTPSAATPSPSGATAPTYRLRATMTQATPALTRFGWLPVAAITADLQVVVAGPQMELYPGPLLPNLQARPISTDGVARIVGLARTLGLLSGDGDFTSPNLEPGASLGRIELVVDGVLHDLTGDPSRLVKCGGGKCVPDPGTPEAFAAFWQAVSDMTWLEADLGPEAPYVAGAYAILVGVEPVEEPSLPPQVVTWPLETSLAAFGKPVGNAPAPSCGTVRGSDAATLRPTLASANQLTRWVDKGAAPVPGTSIQVRPMVPGEDICRELFDISD